MTIQSQIWPLKKHVTLLCTVLLGLAWTSQSHAQVAVITNKSVEIGEINNQELIDIFSLEEIQWKNGREITPIEIKGDDTTKTVFYKFLGRSISDVKRDRLRIILAGEATPPLVFDSPEEVLDKIRNTPGAVGYVPIKIIPPESVNILLIIDQ